MDLNEYISIQNGIIVIIVLNFYDLLDLLLSEDRFKEREFGTERLGIVTGRGKRIQSLVSKMPIISFSFHMSFRSPQMSFLENCLDID